MLDASSLCTIDNWIQRKEVLFRNSNKVLVHKSVKVLFCKDSTIATFRRHFERHLLQCMMSSGGGGSLQRRGRGGFSEMFLRNGSQKCFSETVLEMFLRNGSQKGQMGLQRHRWQERQRIKRVKRVLLNTASAWNEKTKKRNNFDLTFLPRHVWAWGNYIFHISRSDQGGMTVDWSLLPSFLPIITPSLVTQHHQLIPCNHNLAT